MVLIDGVQGGFFLRKKPLKLALPVYSNSETAIKPAAEKTELDVRAEARTLQAEARTLQAEARTLQRPGHPGLFQQAPRAVLQFMCSV